MLLKWLLSWWRRPPRQLDHLNLVLYTRHGCHLCDDAWHLLQKAQREHGFLLQAVDVDGDPELRARFDTCVPVVTVNGRVRFRGRVNPVLLKRLLRAEER